jgi:hypothetical protein
MRQALDKVVLVATACTIVASVALPAAWNAFRRAML